VGTFLFWREEGESPPVEKGDNSLHDSGKSSHKTIALPGEAEPAKGGDRNGLASGSLPKTIDAKKKRTGRLGES